MLSAPILNGNCIPKWLEEDIDRLALKDTRISCAIYELYNYYVNDKTWSDFSEIEAYSDYVDMCVNRLNFIDDNINMIKYLINC